MYCIDLVNKLLFLLRYLRELAPITLAYIFTASTQPESFIFKILNLLLIIRCSRSRSCCFHTAQSPSNVQVKSLRRKHNSVHQSSSLDRWICFNIIASWNVSVNSLPKRAWLQRCLIFFGQVAQLLSVSHILQSSIGSNCPKSPTRIMEISPKSFAAGSMLRSVKYGLFACWRRKCMRAKSARPMKDTSSTISKTTLSHVSSRLRRALPSSSCFQAALGKI